MAITARSLTRKEVRTLKENGINFSTLDKSGQEAVQAGVDATLDLAYQEQIEELDEMAYSDCLQLFRQTVELTFGVGEQEKN